MITQFNNCQKILLNYLSATFDIDTVVELYYQGSIIGSEFLIYDAKKLYLCDTFNAVYTTQGTSLPSIDFYDETNAASYYYHPVSLAYNTVAANYNYVSNDFNLHSFYFSRITSLVFNRMIFRGYKLTLV